MITKAKELIQNNYETFKIKPMQFLIENLEITSYRASIILRDLVKNNFLTRDYNQYRLNTKPSQIKTKGSFLNFKQKNVIIVIRIIMAIIGVFAAFMSVYYTTIWLLDFLPLTLSILLSTIMILFSVAAFETIIIFINNKQKIMTAIFIFLWIIVLGFSILSTVAGQYNKRINTNISDISTKTGIIHKNLQWEMYNEQEKELISLIKNKESELKIVNNLMNQLDTIEKRSDNEKDWLSFLVTKRKAEDKIEKYRAELSLLRIEKMNFLRVEDEAGIVQESTINAPSFFVWLSELFNNSPQIIEFFLSMIPAVFIDIIAPVALAISMFLGSMKNKAL